MHKLILTSLVVSAVVVASGQSRAQDQDLSLIINPLTGVASIRNDSGANVSIDGYLLTSPGSVFNPVGWNTLTGNVSYPGWAQGPAAANRLGEANLLSSLAISGGTSLSLGAPYLPFSPTQIGQLEPGLTFEYSVDGIGSIEGDVVFVPQNNVVLLVNPATGAASLQNQSLFPVEIDGLLITSPAGVLDPIGWQGFAESGAYWLDNRGRGDQSIGRRQSAWFDFPGCRRNAGFHRRADQPRHDHGRDRTTLRVSHRWGRDCRRRRGVLRPLPRPPIAGDYNSDGTVDAADYTIWRDRLGQTYTLRRRETERDHPGGRRPRGLHFWKSRFGATSGSGSGSAGAAFRSQRIVFQNRVPC